MAILFYVLMVLSLLEPLDAYFSRSIPLNCYYQTVHSKSTQIMASTASTAISSSKYRSFFQMNKPTEVLIESPSINSRRITAGIVIDATSTDVWNILTDYDNLATHVPNLVQSYRISSPTGGIRLFQEGAQKIIGFDFRASLTMDMREEDDEAYSRPKRVHFTLVDSAMFSSFDGEWIVKPHSRVKQIDPVSSKLVYRYKTLLVYTVYVRPKGPVPVIALEWRIKEDVPVNLLAMKAAAEKFSRSSSGSKLELVPASDANEWEANETLGMYIVGNDKKTLASKVI